MQDNNFEKQTSRDKFFQQMEKELQAMINPKTGEVYKNLVKKINCPLCGGKKHQLLFKKQGFSFVRCLNCGMVFTNPQIVGKKLVKIYQQESAANQYWREVLLSHSQVEFNNKNYGIILDFIIKHKNFGRLLDIGCSFGHFLKLAREKGFNVEGIELENEAVKYAVEEFKLKIHQKILAECGFKTGEFDIVAALGVLEHVPNPLNFLKNINSILKDSGLLTLTLPNVESLVCMILKEKSRTFTGRNHLTYFSMRTLSKMLKKAGFKIIFQQSYVAGIDSAINEMQFFNPFENKQLKYLPNNFINLLKDKNKKQKLEKLICDLGLGYKLRVIAKKINI